MIKLDSGNVLLKPSHRKQLMSWLRRALRLGQRLGAFVLKITMRRNGRMYEVRAAVQGAAGSFDCRARCHDWRTAFRDLARKLAVRLRAQRIRFAAD